MSPPKVFLLDANVFIESAKRYYAFDIAPGYWVALIKYAGDGPVRSIDKVKDEINRGNDDLTKWVNRNFHVWFESTNQQDVLDAYSTVMTWAQSQSQFTADAKAEFARNADGWLIAYALAKGCVVVTDEQFNSEIKRRIKIPNACIGVGVPYMDTFDMLRDLGVRLQFLSQ
ncbi:MAG: DUF4411 family protein [Methanoregula sp.]|jgi:hypothetical protein